MAGGLGAKMAAPDRDVYVMVGDGSYLMMNSEIVTSIQENYKLIIVLLDNHGFKSIGSLSRSLGQDGFGTRYAYPRNGILPTDSAGTDVQALPVDLAANARSLGAYVIECKTYADFVAALETVQNTDRTSVIYVQNDRYESVPGYESWWDVPVAEVSTSPQVQAARTEWEAMRANERYFL
ncbi:MAG TPA: thiamine pyrophosphate-dependent enzyme [Ktedonobacteraceae bacterium]